MTWLCCVLVLAAVTLAFSSTVEGQFETDTLATSAGDLAMTFIGHGSLLFSYQGKVFHIDPYGRLADYSKLPKADVILLTHEHADHLDPTALASVRTESTVVVLTEACAREVAGGVVMRNGDTLTVQGVCIEAVPAYNIVHRRANGQPYHPKGIGNGYVMTFGDKRVYVAGDTENTPEMKALRDIDCAFLPMNLPYTMTPEMVADAAAAFQPRILYPYHFGDTDTSRLPALLKDYHTIDVRIRRMK
jgi:L-ascorbate metabolism protein UlaG (beta-lactamase superfamily)